MALTKSYTEVSALQALAANTVYVSSEVDMSAKYGGILSIQFARAVTTALTAGVKFRVEIGSVASGNMAWGLLAMFQTTIATAVRLAVTTTSNSGQKELAMSSTTGFALADRIFVEDATLANSEFHEVALIHAATHLTVEENLANTHVDTTTFVANSAERFLCQIPLEVTRLRLVADNDPNAVAAYFKAQLVTVDAIN
jgi:hypothetical protein